jgi:phosphoribosyl 1,2-cyclic phosphodiesterase
MVRVVPLGSGSSGNATVVSFGTRTILVDAGLSARDLAGRLSAVGVEPGTLTAILLSHEHHDHARGLERFAVKHRVPVFTAPETLAALNLAPRHLGAWHPFEPGVPFEAFGVKVDPFTIPHDAVNPVGFVLEAEGVRVGIATDLGHATTLVVERLRGCHVLIVEANHDDGMLVRGPYPWALKQRIAARLGRRRRLPGGDPGAPVGEQQHGRVGTAGGGAGVVGRRSNPLCDARGGAQGADACCGDLSR